MKGLTQQLCVRRSSSEKADNSVVFGVITVCQRRIMDSNLLQKCETPPKLISTLSLKGLSHEIDFKNFDQTLKNLA
jgi:hypothetical protein